MSTRLALVAVLALTGACASDTSAPPQHDPVSDSVDEGHANGDTVAGQAFGEISGNDYMTMIGKTASILAALNDGEINESAFAIQIIEDKDVFEFATDLVAQHEDANNQLDEAVRFYGAGYIPTAADAMLTSEAEEDLATLRATSLDDFAMRYTELQVKTHAEAEVVLDQLAQLTGEGEMGDYIANARAMVDNHLSRAMDLLREYL